MSVDKATIIAAQNGNSKAQEAIIKECLAFIKQWVSKIPSLNQADYDDLVQEGCLGVLQAIKKIDVNKKNKFITYASHWIIKYIYEGLAQTTFHITYPSQVRVNYLKVLAYVNKYFALYEDYPDAEEISENTGIPLSQLKDNSVYPQVELFSATAVNNNDDKEVTILDSLTADDNVQDWAVKESLKKDIHNILKTFDERTRTVIILTYGLEGETAHTYEEVGNSLNLSRQRVEQILKEAKKKIKSNPSMVSLLQTYCCS